MAYLNILINNGCRVNKAKRKLAYRVPLQHKVNL